jgi:hypothetical protein
MAESSERVKLYRDPTVRAFLSKLVREGIAEIEPVYDSKGAYKYPIVETVTTKAEPTEFLNNLYESGILNRKLVGMVVNCPNCGSSKISFQYCCPYCRSLNIEKSSLIEHIKCGYIDVEKNFRKADGLSCPKCNEALKKPDMDYRKAGIWCECLDCGKTFDIPVINHFCRECRTRSTFEEAMMMKVYVYSLKEEVKQETLGGWIESVSIKKILEENGFEVETPAFLKGKSGAEHMFDVAAYKRAKKSEVAVIDFASSTKDPVSEQPVIALFAKIYDVAPDHAYLIVTPKISENGKKMAELYNITIVEASDPKESAESLLETLVHK